MHSNFIDLYQVYDVDFYFQIVRMLNIYFMFLVSLLNVLHVPSGFHRVHTAVRK